jgi:glycosyltransferase involved in cell wall biosynthesis
MSIKKKIMMLGFSHCVDDGRVTFRESIALKQAGYRVRVIGRARGNYLPGVCKPYGIPALALQSRYLQNMILRFVFEPFSWIKFFFVCWKYSSWADVLHCHEYQSLTIGLILGKLRGQKVIYDCHEFQPELFAEMFGSEKSIRYKVIRWFASKVENYQANLCDGIVTVNDFLVERFLEVNNRVCNLPNYPSARLAEEKDVEVNGLDKLKSIIKDKFVIGFAGNLSDDRGVGNLIKSFGVLCTKRDDVVLLLVGNSTSIDIYKKLAKECNVADKVILTGSFKYDELPTYLRLIDIGVYMPQKSDCWRLENAYATKIFQYCAFGIPCILNDIRPHITLVKQLKFACIANTESDFVDKILCLIDNHEKYVMMSENAKLGFEKFWNAEVVVQEFINFYAKI